MTADETNKRNFRVAPFVLAILRFAMPFLEVSCKDEKGKTVDSTTISGFTLAFGGTIKQPNEMTGKVEEKPMKQVSQFFIAFLCAAAGVGASFMAGKNGKLFPAIAGAVGILFLFLGKGNLFGEQVPPQMQDVLQVSAKIGFLLACVCFAAGAVISGLQWKAEDAGVPATYFAPPPPPPPSGAAPSSNLPPVPNQPPPPPPPPGS